MKIELRDKEGTIVQSFEYEPMPIKYGIPRGMWSEVIKESPTVIKFGGNIYALVVEYLPFNRVYLEAKTVSLVPDMIASPQDVCPD